MSYIVAAVSEPLPVTELIEAPAIDALKSPVVNSVFGTAIPKVSTKVLVPVLIGLELEELGDAKEDTVIAGIGCA